jgi:hypothetical protein
MEVRNVKYAINFITQKKAFTNLLKLACLFSSLGLSSLALANTAENLGDRVIVAINDQSYTQRQLEMYFVMRQSLLENQNFAGELITQANWSEALAFFVEEMVLLQEADRIGGAVVPQEQLVKLAKRSTNQFSKNSNLEKLAKKLEMDDALKDSMLVSIQRVESLKNFKNQTSLNRKSDGQNKNLAINEWLNEVFSRTIIRYYKDAKIFRTLGKGSF